ncbi:phage tail protein [Pectobacterium punjabense]|uniref:phage tail-collar fiber domain-containing protein n=1 Tax=Pectobacterium punjabense TaxID=2108399 RepID=UPI002B2474F5|nr:phage tail protein [Pectobacterium punjabense]
MSAKYIALLTNIGAARLANATALGSRLNITRMAVGDGGGTLPMPNPAQTALINEKRRAALNTLSVDPKNPSQIIAEQVIPENEGGFWIREIGLFDDDGNLIAIANCPETYKPQLQEGSGRIQTVRMILIVSSTDAVTLKIDPAVVLATRSYVDSAIDTHEKSRKHPDGTLTAKGFVQLSSATTSDSEVLAATPKAVKAANDNANGRVPSGRRVNGKVLTEDITLGAGDVGAYTKAETDSKVSAANAAANNANDNANSRVPSGRKVNGKVLTEDITLGAGDVGALAKDQNGADIPNKELFNKNIGAGRAYSSAIDFGGVSGEWTTADFINWLRERGAFSHAYWTCRGSWTYANNKTITDTKCGDIDLTGSVVEVFGNETNYTIRVTTPSSAPSPTDYVNSQFTYAFNGVDYSPGWRRDYNTLNKPTAEDVNAYTKEETDTKITVAKDTANNANDNANSRVPSGRKVNGKTLAEDITLGAGDVGALAKDLNGADIPNKELFNKNIGAGRAYSSAIDCGGASGEWTTADFINWLRERGAFSHAYWTCRGSWTYANNKTITDTKCGDINLTGSVVEVFGNETNYTIRVTTPSSAPRHTDYVNSQFTYTFNGIDYFPSWRREYNTHHKPTSDEVGALSLDGGELRNGMKIGGNVGVAMPVDMAVVGMLSGTSHRQMLTLAGDDTIVVGNRSSKIGIVSRENVYFRNNDDGIWHVMYHTGNLTPSGIGAMPASELAGIPLPFPGAVAPTGWLKCNGQQFDTAQFPTLASRYPSGFLPDLRGEFVRGWDDGRGGDAGRALLSAQGDAIRNIAGSIAVSTENTGSSTAAGAFSLTGIGGTVATSGFAGRGIPQFDFDASRVVPTANENRPRNVAFNYIVRAA